MAAQRREFPAGLGGAGSANWQFAPLPNHSHSEELRLKDDDQLVSEEMAQTASLRYPRLLPDRSRFLLFSFFDRRIVTSRRPCKK